MVGQEVVQESVLSAEMMVRSPKTNPSTVHTSAGLGANVSLEWGSVLV